MSRTLLASHQYVTKECRSARGDEGAIEEALYRIRREAVRILRAWPQDADIKLHFRLELEKPDAPQEEPRERNS